MLPTNREARIRVLIVFFVLEFHPKGRQLSPLPKIKYGFYSNVFI